MCTSHPPQDQKGCCVSSTSTSRVCYPHSSISTDLASPEVSLSLLEDHSIKRRAPSSRGVQHDWSPAAPTRMAVTPACSAPVLLLLLLEDVLCGRTPRPCPVACRFCLWLLLSPSCRTQQHGKGRSARVTAAWLILSPLDLFEMELCLICTSFQFCVKRVRDKGALLLFFLLQRNYPSFSLCSFSFSPLKKTSPTNDEEHFVYNNGAYKTIWKTKTFFQMQNKVLECLLLLKNITILYLQNTQLRPVKFGQKGNFR